VNFLPAAHGCVVELAGRQLSWCAFKGAPERTDYSIVIHRMLVFASVLLVASATPAVSASPASPANGPCQCQATPAALIDQVDHIFVGDILEVKGDGEQTAVAVIRVRESFKGDLTGVVQVCDAIPTECAWSVFEMAGPGRYVIFANMDEGDLVTPGYCPQTQPFSGWKDRLGPFRAYAKANRGAPAPGPKPAS
jgi:hypothetical protein